MFSDSPRSDFGFGTPRDDRFHTPRAIHTSSSEEWQTPRHGASDSEYFTPRSVKEHDYRNMGNVPSPHAYWHQVSTARQQHHYAKHPPPPVSTTMPEPEEEDDPSYALGIMEGISDQDVEDIFSYARHNRGADVERLLDKGIPVNIRDEYGNTLLIIACQNGNKRIVKIVLRRQADINARNYKGNTPLHYCYHYGYGDTLGSYLLSKGADSSIRNNIGRPCWDGI